MTIPISMLDQIVAINEAREDSEKIRRVGWDQFLREKDGSRRAVADRRRTLPARASGLPTGVQVRRNKGGDRYAAIIFTNGRSRMIGTFDSPEEAHDAYRKAHIELHGELSRYWSQRHEL